MAPADVISRNYDLWLYSLNMLTVAGRVRRNSLVVPTDSVHVEHKINAIELCDDGVGLKRSGRMTFSRPFWNYGEELQCQMPATPKVLPGHRRTHVSTSVSPDGMQIDWEVTDEPELRKVS